MIDFICRGAGNLLNQSLDLNKIIAQSDKDSIRVYSFLKQNGASYIKDIEQGTGFSTPKLQKILGKLVQEGLVTTDNYHGFLSILNKSFKRGRTSKVNSSRQMIRKNIQDRMLLRTGRWFLTESFAVMGNKLSIEEQIERQARLLLLRHGVLVKEWYRRENSFLPWYQIFQALKRLEWRGEIRRGYFIEGLSGIQFALPEAIDLLQSVPDITPSPTPILVSTIDPALSFGGHISWDLKSEDGNELSIVRAAGNHLLFLEEKPVQYSENYGNRIYTLNSFNPKKAELIIDTFKTWLRLPVHLRPRKKLTIDQINSKPAVESSLASLFLSQGFEKEDNSIILWPSGV
jgi:ATP-dependent Lhr-like helicase